MANGGTTHPSSGAGPTHIPTGAAPAPTLNNTNTTATATAGTGVSTPAPAPAPASSASTPSASYPPLPGILTSSIPMASAPAPMSPSVHVNDWSEQHVGQWLHSLGFVHLVSPFRDHGINGDSLVLLDDDNLQEIGVNSVGQRLALLGEIFRLKETFDIPIEEGDYVPHSAYPGLPVPASSTSESAPALTGMLGAIQQRDDRISALESELSKVTTYLNRLQHDFVQLCDMIGLKNPSSREAPPIFPFSPLRPEAAEPGLLLQPSERVAQDMGLSTSQPVPSSSLLANLPVAPTSAPLTARATPVSTSSSAFTAPPLTSRTTSTSRDSSLGPAAASHANGPSKHSSSVAAPVAALANAVGPAVSGLPGFGSADTDNSYRSFRVILDDPCYRVLPAALRKYKINDDWKKYALIICHGTTERCITYEEKPLLLFQKLKEAKQNPVFMLRHIRDVKNPIALAKAKAEARNKTPSTATGPTGPGAHIVKVPLADVQNLNAASLASASISAATSDKDKTADKQSTNTPSVGEADTSSSLNKSPGGAKRNKVAERVARFEGNASAARPAASASEASTAASPAADTSKESTEKDKDAEDASQSSSGVAIKPSTSTAHTYVVLGSKEWATAMAVRALRNGHDVSKPVLTGAATRLPAASPSATATNTSSSATTATKDATLKNGTSTGTDASAVTSPNATKKYAIAIYPYTSERDDEFDVELGDTFVVLNKIHGWWAVERDPRADGDGDGQVVEVEPPAYPPSSSSASSSSAAGESGPLSLFPAVKKQVRVVRTGWVPAGCLLEMSKPLASAVPNFKDRVDAASFGAPQDTTGASSSPDEKEASQATDENKSSNSTTTNANDTSSKGHPPMAIFPIPPALITSPSTPGIMLMDYTSPPEDKLSLKKGDRLRVFKRYSHWSYCVQESGLNGRGWVPSWYIGKASSSASSNSSRRAGGSSRVGMGHRTTSSSKVSSLQSNSGGTASSSTSTATATEQSKRNADAAGLSNGAGRLDSNGAAPPTSAAKTLSAGLASATGGTMATGFSLAGSASSTKSAVSPPPGVLSSSNGISATPTVSSSGSVPASSSPLPSGVVATVHGPASGAASNNLASTSTATAAGQIS